MHHPAARLILQVYCMDRQVQGRNMQQTITYIIAHMSSLGCSGMARLQIRYCRETRKGKTHSNTSSDCCHGD